MKKLVVLAFITLWAEALIITIDQGTLNGTYNTTRRGKRFNAFYGIPYAQPPVRELRFKPPKEANPWIGILDASSVPTGCLQFCWNMTEIQGSEDCLNLNVFTPLDAREGDNLSVIVYIFGGEFIGFTNMDFGPQYILETNVILVIPNFRLGALGYMTTGDTVISGNYQLKDQTMALKWVQKNIYHFGGNPNDVTLQGTSAGAYCVHLHTLSPLSKGLFHKAILQSGPFMLPFYGPDVIREIVKEFATKAGCLNTTSSESIHSCLMTLDANLFTVIPRSMHIWYSYPSNPFKPCIEDKNAEEPFITQIPSTASQYHTPDMPWIIGITTGESAYRAAEFLGNGGELAAEINQNHKLLYPLTLGYLWNTKSSHLNYVSEILRTHYFGNREIGPETAHELTELYTHAMFGIGTIKTIRSYPGPKYVYLYDYRSNYSCQSLNAYYEEYLGVSHGEERYLMYYTEESDRALTKTDHMFSEELVKRWVNFAQSGNPNRPVKTDRDIMDLWEPMVSDRIEHLRINLNGSMETDLYKGIYDFWIRLPIGDKYAYNDSC